MFSCEICEIFKNTFFHMFLLLLLSCCHTFTTSLQYCYFLHLKKRIHKARSLVVSGLRSETKVPGSSLAATYVQKWALCSNGPANVSVSVKRVEVVLLLHHYYDNSRMIHRDCCNRYDLLYCHFHDSYTYSALMEFMLKWKKKNLSFRHVISLIC